MQHAATCCNTKETCGERLPSGDQGQVITHRTTLQHAAARHTAPQCNTLQHAATQKRLAEKGFPVTIKGKSSHIATYCNMLQQYTATHCDPLQHTATRCNALQHKRDLRRKASQRRSRARRCPSIESSSSNRYESTSVLGFVSCCSVLQCVAVCCIVLPCVAVCYSVLRVLQCSIM